MSARLILIVSAAIIAIAAVVSFSMMFAETGDTVRQAPHIPNDEHAQDSLRRPEIHQRAVTSTPSAAPKANDTAAFVRLRTLLDDPSDVVRGDAVESLRELDDSDAIAGLSYALSDQNAELRQLAIENLADMGTEEAINALALTLNDPDPESRLLAVEELADNGSNTAISLLRLFATDNDPLIREIASGYPEDLSEKGSSEKGSDLFMHGK